VKNFSALYQLLDETSEEKDKISGLVRHFKEANELDLVWAVYLLINGQSKRTVNASKMKDWAMEIAHIPAWLFDISNSGVGDVSETTALLIPTHNHDKPPLLSELMTEILAHLKQGAEEVQKIYSQEFWQQNTTPVRFLYNKIVSGTFKPSVAKQSVIKAFAIYSGIDETIIAQKLSGEWTPSKEVFHLWMGADVSEHKGQPFPFCETAAFDGAVNELPAPEQWTAQWSYGGIRVQIIKRDDKLYIWNKDGELITEQFPDIYEAFKKLSSGIVIDAELMVYKDGQYIVGEDLQKRMKKKIPGKKILQEAPIRAVVTDILEYQGEDIREFEFHKRQTILSNLIKEASQEKMICLHSYTFSTWKKYIALHTECRSIGANGLLVRYSEAKYHEVIHLWKATPYMIHAVLIYAQKEAGQSTYADYTFGIWNQDVLVPAVKLKEGFLEEDTKTMNQFISENTVENFGPVRTVKPALVFEISFDRIHASSRHKSGIVIPSAKPTRLLSDMKPELADTLERVKSFL
jgi:DNA ligase-1